MKRAYGLALVACLILAPSAPEARSDGGVYTFTVLRDGEPIGEHRFAFDHRGDRMEIEESTDIQVTVALIPVFSFEHERRELWQDGRLMSIAARTNDNGELLDIDIKPNGHGLIRTVNGRVDRIDDSQVLTLWNKDVLDHHRFVSVVEDEILKASFHYLGKETITLAGQPLEAEHYRMVGDEERDVWYDPAGHVAKVSFERQGSLIEYVRNEPGPASLVN
jgi:hypothetical protein